MPFPVARRIAGALAVLALALLASATTVLPARGDQVDIPSVIGPADGAVVGGTVVTLTATVPGVGYEFRWDIDDDVDADGRLIDIRDGGQGVVRAVEYSITDLAAGTYYWQVRALDDDAEWAPPRSFTIDPEGEGTQLATYPLESSPGVLAGVDGRIWLAAAAAFSVLLLVVVFHSASRTHRSD